MRKNSCNFAPNLDTFHNLQLHIIHWNNSFFLEKLTIQTANIKMKSTRLDNLLNLFPQQTNPTVFFGYSIEGVSLPLLYLVPSCPCPSILRLRYAGKGGVMLMPLEYPS